MSKNFVNKVHLEGYVYEHDLELKVSGPNSKAPGTEYIAGTVSIATDNACLNVVPVHFSYVTATTKKGAPNATYGVLMDILEGVAGTIMEKGKEKAALVRVDTAIALNEFWTERNGKEEFVSVKRNEGGFIHFMNANELNENEAARSDFLCDFLLTGATRIEGDEEKQTSDKVILKGAIFDFSKALLPVEFSINHPAGMDYFESLEPSPKNPVLTQVRGTQVSETIVRTITEESAFGDPVVREVKSSRKDYLVTWALPNPYEWDDESTLTVTELNEAITARETHLATLKKRNEEYKASKNATPAATTAQSAFNF